MRRVDFASAPFAGVDAYVEQATGKIEIDQPLLHALVESLRACPEELLPEWQRRLGEEIEVKQRDSWERFCALRDGR